MSDSIFNSTQPTSGVEPVVSNTGVAQPDSDVATLLGSIKNERGEPKYKDLPTALASLKHTQTEFIPTLLAEKKKLQEELEALRASSEKIETLEKTVMALTQKSEEVLPTSNPGMTEEKIAELVQNTLSKKQQEAVMQSNITTVASQVKSTFGDKAEEVFYGKARELGLTNEEFNSLAAKTPKAVLSLLGLTGGTPSLPSPMQSGLNTSAFQQTKDSAIRKNTKPVLVGGSTEDFANEAKQSLALANELHDQGLDMRYLADPKNYIKFFGR